MHDRGSALPVIAKQEAGLFPLDHAQCAMSRPATARKPAAHRVKLNAAIPLPQSASIPVTPSFR